MTSQRNSAYFPPVQKREVPNLSTWKFWKWQQQENSVRMNTTSYWHSLFLCFRELPFYNGGVCGQIRCHRSFYSKLVTFWAHIFFSIWSSIIWHKHDKVLVFYLQKQYLVLFFYLFKFFFIPDVNARFRRECISWKYIKP